MKALWIALAIACAARVAAADDKPWAAGIGEADQDAALALYKEGNALFEQDRFKEALPKYEAALAHWRHPAIAYNAAICLINLDRPVEAYADLLDALKFGDAPIGKDLYKEGLRSKKLLEGRIAALEIVCKQPDAQVTLDGEALPGCASGESRRVLADKPHEVVATKPSYQTARQSISLPPGTTRRLVLELVPLASAKKLVRRWDGWKPWAVMIGGGAIAAGVGGTELLLARKNYNAAEKYVNDHCGMGFCSAGIVDGKKAQGDVDQTIAWVAFGVGGAIAAAGFAMIVMNEPHLEHAQVVPSAGPEHAGVTLVGRW